jgi:hypothetical protein
VESEIQAALIAAVATIVAAIITTAGYVYVELRKRRAANSQRAAQRQAAQQADDLTVEHDPAPEAADAARREQR